MDGGQRMDAGPERLPFFGNIALAISKIGWLIEKMSVQVGIYDLEGKGTVIHPVADMLSI